MQHVEEHIVELYYLGGLEDESIRKGVEKHLAECYSCNELYIKIKDFYQEVDNINSLHPKEAKLLGTNSIVTRPNFVSQHRFIPNGIRNGINNSLLYFVTHPAMSTISLVTAIAFFIIGLNFNSIFKSNTPYTIKVFGNESVVKVYNKSAENLFSINYDMRKGLDAQALENQNNIKFTALEDIDNDGEKELITILHNVSQGQLGIDRLNVFDTVGNLKFSRKVGHEINYKENHFDDQYETKAMVVHDFDNDGKKEIYVMATHRNSPVVVTKFDYDGKWIGEYWHYGWFWGFNYLKLGAIEGLLLCGLNDVNSANRLPVVSYIDPNQIHGRLESSQAFGFSESSVFHENQYKYFPIVKPKQEHISKPRIVCLLNTDNSDTFKIAYYINDQDVLGDLLLDRNFKIYEVKVGDTYLLKYGKPSQRILDTLQNK